MLRSASAPVDPCAIGDWSSTLMAEWERSSTGRLDNIAPAAADRRRAAARSATGPPVHSVRCRAVRRFCERGPRWACSRRLLVVGVARRRPPRARLARTRRPLLTYIVGLGTSKPANVVVAGIDGSAPTTLGPANSALLSPDGGAGRGDREELADELDPAAVPVRRRRRRDGALDEPDSSCSCSRGRRTRSYLLVAVGATAAGRLSSSTRRRRPGRTIATGVFYGASFEPGGSDRIVYARAVHVRASTST